jgi:tRNA(fMet)-specific endonuclease VapC
VSLYLLDTSIVSAPLKEQPDPAVMMRFQSAWPECAIAAPVWQALTYRCRRLPPGRRRLRIGNYMSEVLRLSLPILPYDEAAATWHGQERTRLESLGRPAPFVDGQIAAVACVNNLVLVTVNPRDFKNFKRLRVEDWSRGAHHA